MNPLNIARMDWNKLRWFYLMAQFPSLSHAATHLKVEQSQLSRNLGDLEYALGMKLFARKARGIALLQEGKDLLHVISTFFQEFSHYESCRQQQNKQVKGTLRVSISPLLPVSYLIQGTSTFLKKYPEVSFHLLHLDRDKEETFQEADCWVQLYNASPEEGLIQKPLIRLKYGLYAAPRYLNNSRPLNCLKDLRHHKTLVLRTPSETLWGWPEDIQEAPLSAPHEFTTAQDVYGAALQGLGIAALPQCQASGDPGLVALSLPYQAQCFDLCYAYSRQKRFLKRITAYEDFLVKNLNLKKERALGASAGH